MGLGSLPWILVGFMLKDRSEFPGVVRRWLYHFFVDSKAGFLDKAFEVAGFGF